jgi:hypothetical protein
MAKKRAGVISAKDLSRSIDRAVAMAARRRDIKTQPANYLLNWEILGRILRESQDINTAFEFAGEVTRNVRLRGIEASPAVCKLDGDILCGFIEKAGLPKQIAR